MKNNYPLKELVGTKKDLLPHLYKWADSLFVLDKINLEDDIRWNFFLQSIDDNDCIVTYSFIYPFATREGYYAIRNGEIIGLYNVVMS